MARVKSLPCSICNNYGGYAHHIKQGRPWITVALCWDCHQGPITGIHGCKSNWKVKHMDELDALNVTMQRLAATSENY